MGQALGASAGADRRASLCAGTKRTGITELRNGLERLLAIHSLGERNVSIGGTGDDPRGVISRISPIGLTGLDAQISRQACPIA